jgi:hypothetical protein
MAQAVYDGSCSVGLGIVKSAKGFEVRTFVKYGPAELSKQIQPGDMLLNINERSTTTMSLENLEAVRRCSVQSVQSRLTRVLQELMGPPDSTVRLTFVRFSSELFPCHYHFFTRPRPPACTPPLQTRQRQELLSCRSAHTQPATLREAVPGAAAEASGDHTPQH